MKFRIRFAEQVVGLFILGAAVGLAAILILIGINQRWFAKNYHFRSEFLSASGLSVGMPITFKGFEIGRIDAIDLNRKNTVDVRFYVYDTYYDRIKRNSVLELASSPLGLGGGLVYHPGRDDNPAPPQEGYFIPSMDTAEGKRRVEQGLVVIPKSEDMISSLLGQIDPILGQVRSTVEQANNLIATLDAEFSGRGSGPVSTLLNTLNGELSGRGSGPVSHTLEGLNAATGRINTVLDSIQQNVIVEVTNRLNELLDGLSEVTDNVNGMTAALKDPTGAVPRLLGAKGSIPKLLDDDNELYNEIHDMLATVSAIIEQLKGFVQFINGSTPQISGLIEKGQDTLDQGMDVLAAVKNNPLLRGGVPPAKEQQTTFQSVRDVDF